MTLLRTRNHRALWLIVAVLLLAAAARLIGAGSFPVWTDEGWSIWAASSHQLNTILNIVASDRHPPLYFLSLSVWSSFAGESRLALRFPSILGGILTVSVAYRIGADVFGRRAGVFGALLLAVLGSAVYYSQEVRHYGSLTLCTALTWLCFLRFLRTTRRGMWLAYVLSIGLLLYTQYFGALALGVQAVVGLLLWRTSLRHKIELIGAWGAAVLLYGPWMAVILTQQVGILGGGIAGFPGTYAANLGNLLPLGEILFGEQIALTLALYVLGAWAIVLRRGGLIAHGETLKRGVLLGGVGLFFAMFVLSMRFDFLSARTLVFLTPLLMVVCGYGLTLLERRSAFVLACAFVLVSLASPQVIQQRLNSDTAAQTVAAQASSGDLVVLETGWDDNAFAYEFGLALPDGVEIVRTLPWTNDRTGGDPVVPQIEGQLATHERVWVIQWLQAPQVMSFLEDGGSDFRAALAYDTPAGDYGESFGDATVRARLYERPDVEAEPQGFGDLFALHDAITASQITRGEPLQVDLWWSALDVPRLDYSVGLYLLDEAGTVRTEDNTPPHVPTTSWTPEALIFDRHTLTIPSDLPAGTYRIAVSVYWYAEPSAPLLVNGQPYTIVGDVEVKNE